DDHHQTADQRQADAPPDQMLVTLIIGMDRDRRVAEHGLWPGGGDRHLLACLVAVRINHRVIEIVEMTVRVSGENLGEGCFVERGALVARPPERTLALDL